MMKYVVFFNCALVSCILHAEDENKLSLSSKVMIQSHTAFYALSDGSFWKVFSFTPRWRSVSEWWNDVKLIPNSYECDPSDFYVGCDLEILTKLDHDLANHENATNKDIISRCTHLMHNVHTDKYLYALKLKPEHLLTELYNESFKDGYHKGFEKGKQFNNIDASIQYKNGYEAGFYNGYQEALKSQDMRESRPNYPVPTAPPATTSSHVDAFSYTSFDLDQDPS